MPCSKVPIVNFEQVNVSLDITLQATDPLVEIATKFRFYC